MSESFADTIKPKSDQLNADDLMVSPITVKITGVKRGPVDQPVHIAIEGHMPYRPCKSMRRVLISLWGDKGADWVGKSLTLFCDPSVKFGGVELGGIRISHMSDINGITNIMLTTTRGRKAQYTIKPLIIKEQAVELTDSDKAWVAAYKKDNNVFNGREDMPEEYKTFIIQQSKSN